ncbi:MAG TPA: hypothetical protein VHK69_19080 [Chitinophagaceae bacterium]|nr:hypothetical protein [Chitinophagaceae bacterium]
MKTSPRITAVLLATSLLTSCSKEPVYIILVREKARVVPVRYSCGPSCDGLVWSIASPDGQFYDPVHLPPDFQAPQLPVAVAYKRTGQRAPASEGGQERIELVEIRRL